MEPLQPTTQQLSHVAAVSYFLEFSGYAAASDCGGDCGSCFHFRQILTVDSIFLPQLFWLPPLTPLRHFIRPVAATMLPSPFFVSIAVSKVAKTMVTSSFLRLGLLLVDCYFDGVAGELLLWSCCVQHTRRSG